ncbi:unnamed protein product [Polarella glacialis]|uniref:Uncharacterized protein n=1 Tax=Polarella glacialis TaxID=89957 RepID=A0A813M0M0_POLGL|nr:unnamed protein product [Polarella glacialis]CAE8742821.1 unnamed protein product [Polarella glacialis]
MISVLTAEEKKPMLKCIARHLANCTKQAKGRFSDGGRDKQSLLDRFCKEFEEEDLRSILESVEKSELLPEKSKRKGPVGLGLLVSLVMSDTGFWAGDRLPMLAEVATKHMERGIRKDEYTFYFVGLKGSALARPILEKLLKNIRVPLTTGVEESIKKDLASLPPAA